MPARPEPAAAAATTLDDSDESATVALYRAAIGPVRCDYYLPVFTRFDAADRAGPSWNWAACLGTLNWMVFRQLWGPAWIYAAVVAGLVLVTLGIGRLSGAPFGIVTVCLLVALATLSFLVPGFFGNALLFAHCRKRMARALSATNTVSDACVLLNRQSTTRQRIAWLALGNAALAGAAIAVHLSPPPALPLAEIARQPAETRNPAMRPADEPATQAGRAPSASATIPGQPAASPAVPAPLAAVPAPLAAMSAPPVSVSATSAAKPATSVTPAPATASAAPAPSVPPAPPPPTAAPSGTVIAGLTRNPPMPANQSPGPDRPIRRDQPTSVVSAPTVATPATPAPATGAIVGVATRASAPKIPAAKPTPVSKLTPATEPAPPPAAAQVPAAAPTPGPAGAEQRAPAAASTPRYFINVGLFAKDGNAQRAHAKLLAAGLAAFTQELDTPSGRRTRVRAGPFDNRAQADDAAGKIRALELEAMVFRQ